MLIERLLATALWPAFLVLCGSLAARFVGAHRPSPWTEGAALLDVLLDRVVLGVGLLVAVLFGAAVLDLYSPLPLALTTLLLAILGAAALAGERELDHEEGGSGQPRSRLPGLGRLGPLAAVALAALTALLAVLWLQSLRPDVSWDANVYHLSLPKQFLREGGFFAVPLSVYSHWPMGIQLLYGLGMAIHDHVLAKQLHFVFGLLTLLLLARALRTDDGQGENEEKGGTWPALLAVGLFLANHVVLFEIRVAYVDVAFAFALLVAVWCGERLLLAEEEAERRRLLLLLGTACGLVCAIKLSGALGVLAVLLVYGGSRIRRRGPAAAFSDLRWLLPPLLLLALPWPLKSWWLTGNPFYPLFWEQLGGPDWSASLAQQHAAWQSSIGMGRSALDYLLLPWRVVVEGEHGYETFDGRLHLVWLVVLPAVVWRSLRDGRTARLLAVAGLYFVGWALTSQQARFLIPILAVLAWAGARAIGDLARNRLTWAPALLALVTLFVAWGNAWIWVRQAPGLAADLARLGYDANRAVRHPVYEFVDTLPSTSRLLLLNTNHGFHLDRPYLADSFFEASQINAMFEEARSPEQAARILQRRGVSHVLVESREQGMAYPPALIEMLRSQPWARPVYRSPDGRYTVLELAPPGGAFGDSGG